jgi:hypothetical protein
MERGLHAASAAIVCAATIGLSATQTAPQNPGQAATARKYVVIGCISREGQSTPSAGRAAPARPAFTITDMRGDPPATYRLDGDAEQLGLHVGHTVEIAGPVTTGPGARGGGNMSSAVATLAVQSLTYISTTCPKK